MSSAAYGSICTKESRMAMSIQQDEYRETYDIKRGPSNYTLVNFIFPGFSPVTFYTAGKNQKRFDINLISMRSIELLDGSFYDIYERRGWEFEGFISGKRTPFGKVKGTYNSHTRTGKLYVLAHEQPKPIVEVLSWEEVCERVKEKYDGPVFKTSILEWKSRKKGTVSRGYVTRAEISERDHTAAFHCDRWYSLDGREWVGSGVKVVCVNTGKDRPIALVDGRILFPLDFLDYGECTVYPPGFDVDCP